jgi:hypothetical protein
MPMSAAVANRAMMLACRIRRLVLWAKDGCWVIDGTCYQPRRPGSVANPDVPTIETADSRGELAASPLVVPNPVQGVLHGQ